MTWQTEIKTVMAESRTEGSASLILPGTICEFSVFAWKVVYNITGLQCRSAPNICRPRVTIRMEALGPQLTPFSGSSFDSAQIMKDLFHVHMDIPAHSVNLYIPPPLPNSHSLATLWVLR